MRTRIVLLLAGFAWGTAFSALADEEMSPPQTPQESLRSLRLKDVLRVELVAAEPLVASPVAIDFGADGKLWVCEMRDYPMGVDGHWKAGGVIKYLEDRDGDGRYDTATNFLEGVPFPTGVMAWRRGVLICAAPEIIYAEDTDGDGKADVRRTLFQGFATENYQARVNGLSYNLDNWVYGANGLIGGAIKGTASGRSVDIGGRDFRMNPDTGAFEPASGLTQQGRTHDDLGNQFGGNNSILIQHYPFADEYARRNPFVAAPAPAVIVARDADANRLYPSSRPMIRYNHPESANRVTSACSPLVYRDDLLGATYEGNAFTCEPVHNLVHREVLSADGVTFAGRRATDEQESEFLSSTDHWFRPVQVRTGPDGALWIVDMYRFVIEHPRWISPERLADLDVRAGHDKGRIYRVFPHDKAPRTVRVLEKLATTALAACLDTANGTVRDNVQRVLVHRADRAAAPVLTELSQHSTRPAVRAQALWTLDGLNALNPELLRKGLGDASPEVRCQALRIAERSLGKDESINAAVLALVGDQNITVRFQLALTLGGWNNPRAGEALGRLASGGQLDRWLCAAILSAVPQHAAQVLGSALAAPKVDRMLVSGLIATVAGTKDPDAVSTATAAITRSAQGKTPELWRIEALTRLVEANPDAPFTRDPAFRAFRDEAVRLAKTAEANASLRAGALGLLGWDRADRERDRGLLDELLGPQNPSAVQIAALRTLARFREPAADAISLRHWPHLGPSLRPSLLDALLARTDSAERLLGAVERGTIAPGEVAAVYRQRFLNHPDNGLRQRAAKAFASSRPQSREQVLAAYRPATQKPGDAARGKLVFRRICTNCHKYDGQGHEVGPDLAALTDRSADALLTAVLDPNREVDARYASYTAALNDGRVLTGVVASETGNAITLKRQEGQADVILRADLEALKTTGQSLMPEGLEHDLKPEELRDLIAYIADTAPKSKVVPGNQPRTIVQGADGKIRLAAAAAEIYGPTLTFESEFGNLGYWHSTDDHAAWSFRVEHPGTFSVAMEWACADESAGNSFQIQIGEHTLRGKAGGTGAGTWSRYRSLFVGEITLPRGVHRLDFRPSGAIRSSLLDLRAVVLTPRLSNGPPQ